MRTKEIRAARLSISDELVKGSEGAGHYTVALCELGKVTGPAGCTVTVRHAATLGPKVSKHARQSAAAETFDGRAKVRVLS